MRVMKDSGVDWIGIVPEHWDMRRAKAMFRQSTSKGNERLVLLSATQDRGVVDKSTLDSVVQVSEDADLSTFKTVHKNDFVISLRSFQGGFEISHEEGVISPAYTVFRLSKQTYPHFYRHLFKSYGFIDKINSLTVGIREGKNIQYVDFADMLLPYIPLAEQQRIAEFLDRKCAEVDEMIALQEQIIEELKAYKQSVITEAVTKGLNPAAPMRDSGIEWIGSIPKHWEVHRLKSLFSSRVSGEWGDDAKQDERDRICLRIADFDYQRLRFKECESYTIRNYTKEDADLPYLAKGDILIEKSGGGEKTPVGRAVIYDLNFGQVMYANFMTRLRVKSHICPWFVKYVLSAMYSNKAIYVYIKQTTGIQNLDLTAMLENEIVHLPSLTEQQAIADYLDEKCADIDALIATKQQKIDSLKEYKKSIIYEYVTGKREVE